MIRQNTCEIEVFHFICKKMSKKLIVKPSHENFLQDVEHLTVTIPSSKGKTLIGRGSKFGMHFSNEILLIFYFDHSNF